MKSILSKSLGAIGFVSFLLFFLLRLDVFSQQTIYDNFEGKKYIFYLERGGVLDTAIKNPAINSVNKSTKCALYIRNGSRKFDNIKMSLASPLIDIMKYATYEGTPPHFKLKVFTTAPPGTLVEILLGCRKGNNDYPAGTHSQYQAYTKKTNEWEELDFLFSQIPQGSETTPEQVDQIVLLFNPNSSTSDAYYFDDLVGPSMQSGTIDGSLLRNTKSTDLQAPTSTKPEPVPEPEEVKKKKVNKRP